MLYRFLVERNRQLNVRLSPAEVDRLQAVADAYEMSVSATIRLLIRREAAVVKRNIHYELKVVPVDLDPAALQGHLGGDRREDRPK